MPEYDYRIKFRVRAESYGDPVCEITNLEQVSQLSGQQVNAFDSFNMVWNKYVAKANVNEVIDLIDPEEKSIIELFIESFIQLQNEQK